MMHHKGSVSKVRFTSEEDKKLTEIVMSYGTCDWDLVSKVMKTRTARQCRERWNNYISSNLTNAPWTATEDELLNDLYDEYGSRWSKISEFFSNRSANCVRNRIKLLQRKSIVKNEKPIPTEISNPSNIKKDFKGSNDPKQAVSSATHANTLNSMFNEFEFDDFMNLFDSTTSHNQIIM